MSTYEKALQLSGLKQLSIHNAYPVLATLPHDTSRLAEQVSAQTQAKPKVAKNVAFHLRDTK